MSDHPSVSVLLPVYNEADHLDECLGSLAAQDYPGPWEVLVAEGGSVDGTRERLAEWADRLPNLRVLDNPERVQSHGVNRAARHSRAEVLVRADGHTVYAPDFVRRSVDALLDSGAVAAGGLMRPEGRTPFGRAVAAAMTSPLAVGPGRFHYDQAGGPADTAYLPAFRREDFLTAGGYRPFPSGAGEDAELHHRWRRQGRTILLVPSIRSVYRPRETPGALWRQFFHYGWSKAEMLYLNRRFPAWRPLAPLALVAALAGGLLLGLLAGAWWPLAALAVAWGAVLGLVGITRVESPAHALRTTAAAGIMHLAYGSGLWVGLLRGPGPLRELRGP